MDSEKVPAMGFIYGAMDAAKEEIAKNLGGNLGDYKEIWEIIDQKWDFQLHRDLHAAAYYMNPQFQYDINFSDHPEVKRGLLSCMAKLIPDVEDRMKADLQMDNFRSKKGLFGFSGAIQTRMKRSPG